ncbi:hypothetical protein [Clostridium beijerinckii]|jgi:hypothetical protein|uniref:hypothetical protein n=1 Tax=Clostridium beijerinckii TaxID=1520 RepID=UPI001360E6D0|nr:hypothetical protein [Clostridium beijerinckii]MZK53683.1 hypothetical protein [Clostridium beijerinckii]MZK61812.1 hypothetical protein [Clostridium beijerinckii]MZK71993.1 hypothetical protein [Clostridium beijerinckii]MZK77386.1 hypothetical protein [Clostridium beijerinckii]MZK86964.1 hypothetical protein [Clostridium beijerinckii]
MENNQFNIFDEIARTVNNNTHKSIAKSLVGIGLTLGTFNGDSLTLDNFDQEITDYLILDILNLGDSYSTEESNDHTHEFNTPEPLKSIKNGDRVLVAEIGSDCVIIGRVSHG